MQGKEAYERVNSALNDVLLAGRFSGRPLYLSLDNKTRDLLASKLGHEGPGLKSSIARFVGATLDRTGDPYAAHYQNAERWRLFRKHEMPPFTALLFALAHAAGLMAAEGDFGAGNFYDRLSTALQFPAQPLRFNGKSTLPFWRMFNGWLAENDFEFGQPTAKAFNSNIYINYPQSQAVIRAGDRHLFHHLFARFHLSNADNVSVGEIEQYVSSWIHSSASNDRLRSAWAKPELRGRFCEIVQAELEEWSQEEKAGNGNQAKLSRLALVCSLVQQFPNPRLQLSLGRTGDLTGPLLKSHKASNGFVARLANETYGSLATLSPNPIESIFGLLDVGLKVNSAGSSLTWRPRLVIPFRKSEEGPFWIETARVGFGTTHIVLVRDIPRLRKEVNAYLAEASSGLARVATPSKLPGVPEGWIAYTDLQIIVPGLDMSSRKDLEPLAPLQDQAGIVPDGGLRLARGIWHSHNPPSLHFMATTGSTQLSVTAYGDGEEECLIASEGQGRQAIIREEQLAGLGAGEFIAIAICDDKHIDDATIVLRSASSPRPMARQGAGALEYTNPVSACPKPTSDPNGETCRQNALAGFQTGLVRQATPHTNHLPTGTEEAATWTLSRPLLNAGGPTNCVRNGYHIWLCETPDRDAPRSAPVLMQCKECGQSILTKNRGKKPKPATSALSAPELWSPASDYQDQIDHDLILDALCFLGSGNIARLESLLASKVQEPWQVAQMADQYSALGFIDLHRDQASGRIKAWSVPAPSITFMDNSTAAYSGFRSRETCTWLKTFVERLGGKATFMPLPGRPAMIKIQSLMPDRFIDAIDGKEDPLGRPWSAIPNIADYYSGLFNTLQPLGAAMSPASIAASDINAMFDTAKAKWLQASGSARTGAFRAGFAGTTYGFRHPDGICVTGPYQLVKLLAARSAGSRLHLYQPASKSFLSTLGAEPLGLYERALVSSSGNLPETIDGLLHYKNVPHELGELIMKQLYEAPLA